MSDRSVSRLASVYGAQMSSHLQQCTLASGVWHCLGCAAEAVHGFLAQRFVTTTVVVAVVLAVASS